MSSFDGTFSCDHALQRFLARCPALRADPRLSALVQSGAALDAGDATAVLADPFLHPSYTIPVVGCFRPIVRRIAERAVGKLRMVPCLESVADEEDGEEIGDDDMYVIDFYVGRGRGLRLHELACLAFARALDLMPFLLSYVLAYFRFSPPPFRRLYPITSVSQFTGKVMHQLLLAIRVSYRFVYMEPKVFFELWDWSCFLDITHNSTSLAFGDVMTSLGNLSDLRWCCVQILSVVLKTSDRVTINFGITADEALMCLLRWEEFCQDTALEKAGWYFQPNRFESQNHQYQVANFGYYLESVGNVSLTNVPTNYQETELERKFHKNSILCDTKLPGSPFILTSSVKKSFEMVLMAVSQRWPVLLHGPPGAGKTSLINKLAYINQNQVIFIHMDEQMDSKTLIGSYVCTEQPGDFRWQPGTLTQAVLKGYWVVFEDIDKAPNEVHSIILPLLEGSSSFVTGHGEAAEVAESFRLFATVSASKPDLSRVREGSALWRNVTLGIASKGDLLEIVNAQYRSLETFSGKLVDTYERVNSLSCCQMGGIQLTGASSAGVYNRFSLRDLLKWCRRIADLGLVCSTLALSASVCKWIYQEAIDIFAASSSSAEIRFIIMREIANIWGVPVPEEKNLWDSNKPIVQALPSDLQIGRITLQCTRRVNLRLRRPFVGFRTSLQILERIACSIKYNEPVLLVGETGTGKTTLVQNVAMWLGHSLTVVNLSQQSDISDLLGGFKPTDARSICIPLYQELKGLFWKTFSEKGNEDFFHCFEIYVIERSWKKLLRACQHAAELGHKKVTQRNEHIQGSKRKRPSGEVLHEWESLALRLDTARKQVATSTGMSFTFVEGAFVNALRKGEWILLDEINLAPPEVLQRVVGVLDGDTGKLCLAERGDVDCIDCHPQFRIFACMNPATDAGKRELPYSFRSRFTEYFVDDILDLEDLNLFVSQYLDDINTNGEIVSKIVQFYIKAKRLSEERLQDGANQKPQFSLRSLARALDYTKMAQATFGLHKALYDGFCMFFLTLLDTASAKIMNDVILSCLLGGNKPPDIPFDKYFTEKSEVQRFKSNSFVDSYVLTKSVKQHLKNLARAVYVKRYPVLLQGPTSSGKTSLVQYLASVTGHEFVRINNHEHTDLQEYFGSYITDSHGRLRFQEGVLVKAVRKGYWIVLDELNLAPSDVLEALNRLLDDNRELFVPELQETVCAHPNFMLFATQNPPTLYGGRKVLSRAFRNRFVEIHVDEIPENELTIILEKRCMVPASYAVKMVEVMKDLQLHRQHSKVFAGKHGFITPRDLFRWANRFRMYGNSYEDLAKDGYLILAERLREENEKNIVKETLERHLRVKLIIDDLFKESGSTHVYDLQEHLGGPESLGSIVWTKSMWRLYFLVERCYKMREPVLLVGETGGGKTTVCQLLSRSLGSRLHILNCHQYTETSDFIGGFYPVRDRSRLSLEFKQHVEWVKTSKVFLRFEEKIVLSSDIAQASLTINQLDEIINDFKRDITLHPGNTQQDVDDYEQVKLKMMKLQQKWQAIFLWQDGPLVEAMKEGDLFLVDEISLADDSVLERLNSVLEPERKLALAEKGGSILETITAHPNFFILATMNPSGDYGKKELSPALRNRFTEIWVPPVTDMDELRSIAIDRSKNSETLQFSECLLMFWQWFNQLYTGRTLTVRDLLSWISFMNVMERRLKPEYAFIHGAFLVLLDGLSLGTGVSKSDANKLREHALHFLLEGLKVIPSVSVDSCLSKLETYGWGDVESNTGMSCHGVNSEALFGVDPFFITKGQNECKSKGFQFLAPTTNRNALRVLRAMQLPKPVLLEGSPGVGKTSLVVALAEFSGHTVVRINLSEQTDMMDLLGSDLPIEGVNGMEFSWSDGILLQALKNGSWVLLDELNLAPQAVLEGLNAILDHRSEVYIPELGLTFKCPPSFRVFACQNPSSQGGGRKGLPKSFLNRFTKVYVDELVSDDYHYICQSLYPSISKSLLSNLILFNNRLYDDTMLLCKYGQEGSPWEFNLRDIIRSCQIIEGAPENAKVDSFLSTVYLQRMRTVADRKEVIMLYEAVFGVKPSLNSCPNVHINPEYLRVGNAAVQRNRFQPTKVAKSELAILPGIRESLEAVVSTIQHGWLCILVGPYSSGKTSLIRLLAQITGNQLNELNLSSGTDVSELLGCFEQYNSFRTCKAVIEDVARYVDEFFSLRLYSDWKKLIGERKDLFTKWFSFVAAKSLESWRSGDCSSLGPLIDIIEQLKCDVEMYNLPVSWSHNELTKTLKTVLKLQKRNVMQPSAKFEWVAGDLVKAIECGEWVVLENANLCNPTVLDRINSLVEPDGRIIINECGLVEGKPVVLNAHPNFRMFLTVDPRYGEVSRAMRNRGVEIFLMRPNLPLDSGVNACEESEINDVKTFLILSGIPFGKLVQAMSDAHFYAKNSAIQCGVRVTLLELTRWVQLFQHLLMSGNESTWSLQLSYEHTYLSSLGELGGRDVITQTKCSYLSGKEHKIGPMLESSLLLPGGWPAPNTLKKLLWHSREAGIRRMFTYLAFLGAHYASYKLFISRKVGLLNATVRVQPSIMPMFMIQKILFPNDLDQHNLKSNEFAEFDVAQANQKLFIAANWSFEQATIDEFALYIKWFKWYDSQVSPYCCFFRSFINILEQERDHPIWKCILDSSKEVYSHHNIEADVETIPILSTKLVELAGLYVSQQRANRLDNAIYCLGLLRSSLQQWNAETDYAYNKETFQMEALSVLDSLRCLEKEVLNVVVNSWELSAVYSNLLDYHVRFWKGLTSSHFESMLIAWNGLKKEALKLQPMFPQAVGAVIGSHILGGIPTWDFLVEKPLLWIHGGHPVLPSSPAAYYKMQQLLSSVNAIWPRKIQQNCEDNISLETDVALSVDVECRLLALQGFCMSSYVMTKVNQHDVNIVLQVEELHQRLLARLEYERIKLQSRIKSSALLLGIPTSICCRFSPEMLCKQECFNSWVLTQPLFDRKSYSLDIVLLESLSRCTLVDTSEVCKALSDASGLLKHAMDYSLSFSSRSPIDFSPHQMILWMLDAWDSVDSVHKKFATFVLQLWFNWHSSLWSYCSDLTKKLAQSGYEEPCPLIQLTRTKILHSILQSSFNIKDYDVHCLRLRVTSNCLWQDAPSHTNFIGLLQASADSLFKQVIFAHKKSFNKGAFEKIESILSHALGDGLTMETLHILCSLIRSSSHGGLVSFTDSIIEPLLKELYFESPPYELLCSIGRAWLLIGALRFQLLLNPNGPDPAMKYALKHSWLLEKTSLVDLEIKVRRECKQLAGRNLCGESEKKRVCSLQNLEREQQRLHAKVVYRPEPSKYNNLRVACTGFLGFVSKCLELVKNLKCPSDLPNMINIASNWQVTSASFITTMSQEYAEYIDIIQPIQVAVYEMKLGLSIIVSSALQGEVLSKIKGGNIEEIIVVIQSLMQFPKSFPAVSIPVGLDGLVPILMPCSRGISGSDQIIDINVLEKLVKVSSEINPNKPVSVVKVRATLHHILLIQEAHRVSSSRFMDEASFRRLNEIFDVFVSLWMDVKSRVKAKDDVEAHCYKFRPRAIRIEDILQGDLLSLRISDSDDSTTHESEETLEQEFSEVKEPAKPEENIEEEWDQIPDSILNSMVLIHNQLFGSSDLVEQPAVCRIADEDRLYSFIDSYELGSRIMNGLSHVLPYPTLDDTLLPEHFLRVCLEYENTMSSVSQSTKPYNFYKDSNPSIMFEMVKPLMAVQERVRYFLDEWPDHPGLQKILDITEMLLVIPASTPLSKALLGLQFLVSRAHFLQENASRFLLDDLLQPIYRLVSTWQKLELDCWPALIDGVQEQYEINAGKLWFPLQAVLHNLSLDVESDDISITPSIEEFIKTSSIGEFKRRLQLLLAFHGEFQYGICLKAYTGHHSNYKEQILKILYNAFGYYVQFLPLVVEHTEASRKCIEKELKDQLKLFQWDHPHHYLSIENFRRTRQKIWKLIKKFDDFLRQPWMVVINQETVLKRDDIQVWLDKQIYDEMAVEMSQFPLDIVQLCNKERFRWFGDWKTMANLALKNICNGSTSTAKNLRRTLFSGSNFGNFKLKLEEYWKFLDKICRSTIEFAHLWKCEGKSLKKTRLLGGLLKILGGAGLSKRRSAIADVENKDRQGSLFLKPSYDVLHLLQQDICQTIKGGNANLPMDSKALVNDNSALKWKAANKYYFRNLAIMQHVRQICLDFNKDLSLEQVNQAVSFLDHLIIIQQEQRSTAYDLSKQMRKLKQQFNMLNSMCTGQNSQESCQKSVHESLMNISASKTFLGSCSIASLQHDVLRCMWLQKHLFDNLLAMSKDVCLLLETAKTSHLHTCDILKVEADKILAVINKFIPMFVKSREFLNKYLLGNDETVTVSAQCHAFIATKQMEQFVISNFQVINSFEEDLHNLGMENLSTTSMKGPLLKRFDSVIKMGKMMKGDFHSALEANESVCETFSELNTKFSRNFEETEKLMTEAFRKLDKLLCSHDFPGCCSTENIAWWKLLSESFKEALNSDKICDSLHETIIAARTLANSAAGRKPEVQFQIEMHLNHLHMSLNLLLVFGEGILSEFLDVHRAITEMTNVLAHIFAFLFSKGFGSVEEPTETSPGESRDASGTGMGEGEGINDVSDQIEDEAQLLGTSQKEEHMDDSNNLPSDKNRGIEMDEDFTAEAFSISEDSGDEKSEDGDDMNLESKMGDTADCNQVVDEKPWNADEDGNPDKSVEKYESGPSVKEMDSSSRELRAKEDEAMSGDESGDPDNNGSDKISEEEMKPSTPINDEETNDDAMVDQNDAYEDPTGIQFNEQETKFEDANMDEPQGSDTMDAMDPEHSDSDAEMKEEDERSSPTDRIDENSVQVDELTDTNEEGGKDADMEPVDSRKDTIQSNRSEPFDAPKQGQGSAEEVGYPYTMDSITEPDLHQSCSHDMNNSLTAENLLSDNVPKPELILPDSSNGSRLSSGQREPLSSESAEQSVPRTYPNPFRSMGDALEAWKERVKISSDSEEIQSESLVDLEDERADEYRYVSEAEKGTSQTRGPAANDQIVHNFEGNRSEKDENDFLNKEKENKTSVLEEKSNMLDLKTSKASSRRQQSMDEQLDMVVDNDAPSEEMQENYPNSCLGDMVSFKNSYMDGKALPVDTLSVHEVLSKGVEVEEATDDLKRKAVADWKKCEHSTTKLSQELAEQLRLVMEPTLASKLQGDYRTGKRINMKKVIPYIASHFRKDKIWLRRTRPNKRNYQVVVAIDDSRSMSESHCGNVAVEALVTVCRAMSQLEVGQLAVASFGEKGNINLLHEFDNPFTPEAGVKMISSLSFKQDNTIADEPVVNLLTYLNDMLDAAVARARMPSGQNPLHQLILIIADGRFHEKENLKQRVRDLLSRRRMIAFILLDSPQESIMELMEASFEGEKLSFAKYLNSFPFPYYIVLRNIEALPRTLADLLRQWFELMQGLNE